ncbi:SRPBCC family protein [Microlunatus soli]|uniref:Polyketide cyclase / dehydrase and lipid transport n=1 Tax=Microlunatus soli TaxID=630515 RepID=A0A1H1NBL5_9ACTN|nr:SRPBCC family protein [Microlunatus soli]SDR96298.1 Polyketide cyclase / dehydrase and lipid transport [Microlunatus soli]
MGIAQDSIDVNVPIQKAYNQWTQFESFPQFMNGVKSVEQLDDKHLHWKISVAGASREYDAEITEQRPDEVIAWQSSGDNDHSGTVTFEQLDDTTTKVTAAIGYSTEGATEKLADAVNAPERQLSSDLARFKKFIESPEPETGAWRDEIH